MSTTVSIVGTAGRSGQPDKAIYMRMVEKCKAFLDSLDDPQLISGGAAWADHCAVTLHKMYGYPLTLHLPCKWDLDARKFHEGTGSWTKNPGPTANFYHHKFSATMGQFDDASLISIDELIRDQRIRTTVSEGFHARNQKVAASDIIKAFTYGKTCPTPGGTAHTWSLAKGLRIHTNIHTLEQPNG